MADIRRLPGPVADIWDWQLRGACRSLDSAKFFNPDGERGSTRARREAEAKAVCRVCPVRAECAAHSLRVREPYGVWGGFTEAERAQLLAIGWEDLVDRYRRRVDLRRLEARLTAPRLPTTPIRRVRPQGTVAGCVDRPMKPQPSTVTFTECHPVAPSGVTGRRSAG